MAIKFLNTVQVDTDVLYVNTTNNNVGIGTDNPLSTLHVAGPSTLATQGTVLKIENTADQGSSQDIHIYNQYDRDIGIKFETLGGTNYIWQDSNSDDSLILSSGGTNRTNDTTLIINQSHNVFVPNGKVGIGMTSADNLLTLQSSGDTILQINRKDDTIAGGNRTGIIQFGAKGSWGTNLQTSKIWSYAEETFTSTANGTSLRFFTTELGAAAPTEKMIIDTNGNVGIGTDNPVAKLHVNAGTSNTVGYFESTDARSRIVLKDNSGEVHLNAIGDNITFETSASGTERMRITSAGNVGIGTTSPDALLDVSSGSTSTFRLSNTDTALTEGQITGAIEFQQSDSTSGGTGVSAAIKTRSSARPDSGIYFGQSADLGFFVSGSSDGAVSAALVEAMTVRAPGNVGIGTTSPVSPLTVKSNSVSSGESGIVIQANGNTNSIIKLGERGTDGGRFEMLDANVTKIALYTDGTSNYINTGNVGIGTTSPSYKLSVNGTIQSDLIRGYTYPDHSFLDFDYDQTAASNTTSLVSIGRVSYISDSNGNDPATSIGHSFMTGTTDIDTATPLLTILNNGKVGIGTTSPSVQLDIEDSSNVIVDMNTTTADANTTIRLQESGTVKATIGYDGTNDGLILTTGGFTAGNGIFIDDTQKVGIGTTSPTRKFVVSNSGASGIEIEPNYTTGVNEILSFNRSSSAYEVMRLNGGSFEFQIGGNEKMVLSSAGALKLNTYTAGTLVSDASGNITVSSGGGAGGPYLPLAGNTTATAMTGDIFLANQKQARFLTSANTVGLRLQSSGTSSFIDNEVGDMYIRQEADGNDMIFQADDGSGSNATYFRLDGSEQRIKFSEETSFQANTRYIDNVIAQFGNSDDLQIYHDGTNDYIVSNGTYNIFEANNHIFRNLASNEDYAKFIGNGAVELYYNGIKKFETTSTGVTVTGDIQIDSALLSNQENTDIDSAAAEMVAQVAIATYTAAFFDFVIKKTTNVRSGTVYACHDGTNVEFTETSTQDLGDTSDVVLSVDISGGDMRLMATVASDDWSVKSLIRAI